MQRKAAQGGNLMGVKGAGLVQKMGGFPLQHSRPHSGPEPQNAGVGPPGFRPWPSPIAMPSPASGSRSGISQIVGLAVFQGFGEETVLTRTTTPMQTWVAPQRRNAVSLSSSVQSVHLTSC